MRVILGSLLAVVFGAVVCTALWLLGVSVAGLISGRPPESLVFALYVLIYAGAGSLATWAILFVWLYAFIPQSSPLWQWPLCTLCGSAAGFLIVAVFGLFAGVNSYAWMLMVFGGSAAVTGAATCWFAAMTVKTFRHE